MTLPPRWVRTTVDGIKANTEYSCTGGPFGSDLTTKDYMPQGVPVIRGSNLSGKESRWSEDDLVFVSESKAESLRTCVAGVGDFIFTQRGTVGQVVRISENSRYSRYIISQSQMKLSVGNGVDHGYLEWYFKSPDFQRYIQKKTLQTGVPHINLGILRSAPVAFPQDIHEQRRIADILDKADAIRRKRKEALALTDELLRATFLEMFGDPVTGKKFPKVAIGTLIDQGASLVDGPFGSSLKPERYTEKGVRVIRNCNVCNEGFDASAFKYIPVELFDRLRRSEVLANDVLMTIKGTVGDVCLMPDFGAPSVLSATGTCRLRLNKESHLLPDFLVSQMTLPSFKDYILEFKAGSAQPYVNLSAIKKMNLLRPSLDAQEQFLAKKRANRAIHQEMSHAADLVAGLFSSLQHRAFRGEL